MYRADAIGNKLIGWLRQLSTCSQPWQIAAAVVLGSACGLLPKANLLFPLSLALIYILPIHLPVAVLSMLVLSPLAPLVHPVHAALGMWLFQFNGPLQLVNRIDRVAFAPWLGLHNSVMMGSLLLSSTVAIPLYLLIHRILLIHHTSWMAGQNQQDFELAMLKKREAMNSLQAPFVLPKEGKLAKQRPKIVEPQVEPKPLAPLNASHFTRTDTQDRTLAAEALVETRSRTTRPAAASIDSVHALENLLEQTAADQTEKIDTETILARATKAAELVDNIVQALEAELIQRVDNDHQTETYQAHDTTISISRSSGSLKNQEPTNMLRTSNTFFPTKDSMILASHSPKVTPPTPKQRLGTIGENDSVTQAHETATRNVEIRHEEALRHLLNHLRSIHEEVK